MRQLVRAWSRTRAHMASVVAMVGSRKARPLVPAAGPGDALCRYGAEWTATKLRWGLAVDALEWDRLLDIAAGCGGTDVEVTPAP